MRTPRNIFASISAAGLLLLTACGDGGDEETPESMTLWARGVAEDQAFLEALIEAYEDETGIAIEATFIPQEQFVQNFGTAAATGDGPDIALVDVAYMPYFASTGTLDPLTEQIQGLDYSEELAPSMLEAGTWDDEVYGVPFYLDVSMLYWNKDLFEEAGLDPEAPPADWNEFADAANAISDLSDDVNGFYVSGACGGCMTFHIFPFIWASGGDVMEGEDEATRPTLDDPVVTETYEFLQELWDDGVMPNGAQTDSGTNYGGGFGAGDLGMTMLGSWNISQLLTDEVDIDFGVAGMPGRNGEDPVSFIGGDSITVPADSDYPEAAFDFIEWITGEDAVEIMVDYNVMPSRMDLIEELMVPIDERYQAFADAVATGQTPQNVDQNAIYMDATSPMMTLNEAIFTGADIEAAQESAQTSAEGIAGE
ncbi:ABC transporter substrate-binding protein [Nesterenkonia alba]|uniref:ABC transporter substrate-binding protein n=1 Tax=Nesterenkonia alba TaxID=515814 RepID=UPI000420D205|nr:sugar ABC transporter substrate-binding protein [Nesterenkonia alba]